MRKNVPANWDKRHTRTISFLSHLRKTKSHLNGIQSFFYARNETLSRYSMVN